MANCDEIDYTAWQDMNELPNNIFPKLIDTVDEEDESEVDEEENIDDEVGIWFESCLQMRESFSYPLTSWVERSTSNARTTNSWRINK